MSLVDDLRAVRGKIEDPKSWVQRAFALTANGEKVHGFNRAAVCWCVEGAIEAVTGTTWGMNDPRYRALHSVLVKIGGSNPLGVYNDTHTHAEVLELIDAAIARAEQEAA